MPPDALPSCFKPQATVVSAAVISPASTPSCLSAASSIDNLAGPLTELSAAGASGPADGATGTERKEGESERKLNITCLHLLFPSVRGERYPVNKTHCHQNWAQWICHWNEWLKVLKNLQSSYNLNVFVVFFVFIKLSIMIFLLILQSLLSFI